MRKTAERGFSLIEVLIALALVSILILGAAELVILSIRIKMKADGNLEMTDLASSRLDESKAAAGTAEAFAVVGRRQAPYRGSWESSGAEGTILRFGFEIYPELEPEAVLALTILFSKDLGF